MRPRPCGGVPIGLLHSVGALELAALRADSELVSRITHGSPAQSSATLAVAFVTQLAARGQVPPTEWAGATAAVLGAGAMHDVLHRATVGNHVTNCDVPTPEEQIWLGIRAATAADTFASAVIDAINGPGKADTVGAIAGAVAGARFGVEGIPQPADRRVGRADLRVAGGALAATGGTVPGRRDPRPAHRRSTATSSAVPAASVADNRCGGLVLTRRGAFQQEIDQPRGGVGVAGGAGSSGHLRPSFAVIEQPVDEFA